METLPEAPRRIGGNLRYPSGHEANLTTPTSNTLCGASATAKRMTRGKSLTCRSLRAAHWRRRASGLTLLTGIALGCGGEASMHAAPGASGGAPRTVGLRNRCPEAVEIWVGVNEPQLSAPGTESGSQVVGAGRVVDLNLVGKQRIWLRSAGDGTVASFTSTPAANDGDELEIDAGCRHFVTSDQGGHTP